MSGNVFSVDGVEAALLLASASVPAPVSASPSASTSASMPVSSGATADGSRPCSQGRVGEGCEPLAASPKEAPATPALRAGSPPPDPQPSGDSPMALVGTRANGAQAVPPPLSQGEQSNASGVAQGHTASVGVPAKPHTFGKPAEGPGIGGAVFALILVVSLILGLGWLARRMPGVGGRASNNALRVVTSLALGPRDRVVVVDVGGTQLLLGVGQGGMRHLHTLAEPLPTAQVSQGNPATPFAQLLAQHFGKKP